MTRLLNLLFLCGLGVGIQFRAEATEFGDPAPGLSVREWVKGEKVQFRDGDTNVYVIDFWATWSPICETTVRRLAQLDSNFRKVGLVVVGIADESPEVVKAFLKKVGPSQQYAIGLDAGHQTFRDFMGLYGVTSVPHTFVIDRSGKIVWHGNPMKGLDDAVLRRLFKGFDPAAAPARFKDGEQVREYLGRARKGESPGSLKKLGGEVMETVGRDAELLNHFAWELLTDEQLKERDLDLADSVARKAYEISSGKIPAIIDTYARALFATGKREEAIRLQESAMKLVRDERFRKRLAETLKGYKATVK